MPDPPCDGLRRWGGRRAGVGACGPEPAVTTMTDSTTAPTLDTTAEAPEADQAPETDRDTGQVGASSR